MISFKRVCVFAALLILCCTTVFASDVDSGAGEPLPEPTATVEPTPTVEPTVEPTAIPTAEPTVTPQPTVAPPVVVVIQPEVEATPEPTETPVPTPEPVPGITYQRPQEVQPDGFSLVIQELFGTYSPRMQEVVTVSADGVEIISVEPVLGLAGLDWLWIAGFVLFAIVLNGLLIVVGVLLKNA